MLSELDDPGDDFIQLNFYVKSREQKINGLRSFQDETLLSANTYAGIVKIHHFDHLRLTKCPAIVTPTGLQGAAARYSFHKEVGFGKDAPARILQGVWINYFCSVAE